jgi:hypothetical protein
VVGVAFLSGKVPLALLLVGLAVLVVGAFFAKDTHGPAATLLGIALTLIVYIPLTVGAMYLTASLPGVSFGILKTAVLNLAAITVFAHAPNQVADWLRHPLLGWLAAVAASLFLFSYCFDLDIRETVLSSVAILVIRFVLGMGVALLLGLLPAAA